MTNPIAIRRAKKMAEEAAGRSLRYDNVWITEAGTGVSGEYQARFTVPRTDGFFICNQTLYLELEEFAAYEAWKEEKDEAAAREIDRP